MRRVPRLSALTLAALCVVPLQSEAGGHCDAGKLAKLDRALGEMSAELKPTLVAAALAEACDLPPSLKSSFERMVALPHDDWWRAAMLVVQDRELWSRACRGGVQAAAAAGRMGDSQFGPRERADALWSGCDVESLGLATRDEWKRATRAAEVALAAHVWLREANVPAAQVKTYCRGLAGLDAPSESSLAERFPGGGAPTREQTAGALTIVRAGYLGAEHVASALTDTVVAGASALAPCFKGVSLPPGFALRLVIADGVAKNGELTTLRKKDHATLVDRYANPTLEACLLGQVGRLRFPAFAEPTTLELWMTLKP